MVIKVLLGIDPSPMWYMIVAMPVIHGTAWIIESQFGVDFAKQNVGTVLQMLSSGGIILAKEVSRKIIVFMSMPPSRCTALYFVILQNPNFLAASRLGVRVRWVCLDVPDVRRLPFCVHSDRGERLQRPRSANAGAHLHQSLNWFPGGDRGPLAGRHSFPVCT